MKKFPLPRFFFYFGSAILIALSLSCTQKTSQYYTLPAFSENGNLQCVIEIPAGTNKKVEFNTTTKTFEIDQRNGRDRVINFLGYPGNYGFIPSTYSDPEQGGDGDALDILVLSESVSTGTIMEVIPIGVIRLIDAGEADDKIVAVPVNVNLRTIRATSLAQFQEDYREAKIILDTWFLNYDSDDTAESKGWGDEKEALNEILRLQK